MKKLTFLVLVWMCSCVQLFAQQNNKTIREDGAYLIVEQLPQFPGGTPAMMKYITDNVKYPAEAFKQGIGGRVVVQFVVEVDGKLGRMKVLRSVHPLLDAEASRVIAGMPAWKPGEDKGKIVPVVYAIPVVFKQSSTIESNNSGGIVVSGDTNVAPNVQGIWQLCMLARPQEDGAYRVIPAPCIKLLSADKTFVTLMTITQPNVKSFINASGTYRQTSDSTYVESVTKSMTDNVLIGREVELTFKLLNSNMLMITYLMPGAPRRATEYWTRVIQELPSGSKRENNILKVAL